MTRVIISAMIGLLATLAGCGWEQKVVSRAPSANASIQIEQPFPANGWGIRVLLETNGHTKILYKLRGDVFLDFADVVWSSDNRVAVFTCGTPSIKVAYSLRNDGGFIPFAQMQPIVAGHIRSEYGLAIANAKKNDKDIFEWACSPDGKRAFLSVYPRAYPR